MTDKFPEAFERFEKDVKLDDHKTFNQVVFSFGNWQRERGVYKVSRTQKNLIERELDNRGFFDREPEPTARIQFTKTQDQTTTKTIVFKQRFWQKRSDGVKQRYWQKVTRKIKVQL